MHPLLRTVPDAALVLPCNQHKVCWLCVMAAPEPYTDGDAQDWAEQHPEREV